MGERVARCIKWQGVLLMTAMVVALNAGAAETSDTESDDGTAGTARYLQEEQFRQEQQRMQDHRDAQRESSNARQQDVQNRIQRRRDEMMREMNQKP